VPMMQAGDLIPHFAVTDISGRLVRYDVIWQRRALVLVCVPSDVSSSVTDNISRLVSGMAQYADDTTCVVTHDPVARVDAPAVVVADQWGEVVHVAAAATVDVLPDPGEVLTWVHFLRIRCPECEGEAR